MGELSGRPREDKPSTAWRIALGCGAGCLLFLIVGGIACVSVCRHLTARSPVDRQTTVLTGEEIGHGWLYVTDTDPGMSSVRRHLERAFQRMGERAGGEKTKVDLSASATVLPVRLQVRAYAPPPGKTAPSLVGEAELSSGHNAVSMILRVVARERREPVGRASVYHFPDEGDEFWLGILGNRVVVARDRARVVPLVDGSHAPAPIHAPGVAERLLQAVRLPVEDAGAWATRAADPRLDWMDAGALSADLATEDRLDFRLAFQVPEGLPRDEVEAAIGSWLRERVPAELVVALGPAEWLDARTVRYAGTVTGIAAALERRFTRQREE